MFDFYPVTYSFSIEIKETRFETVRRCDGSPLRRFAAATVRRCDGFSRRWFATAINV
jgi:hypothetical protein